MDDFLVFNKDEETELENFDEDANENENGTADNTFVKFLDELTKKSENLRNDKNCSDVKEGHMLDFCKKYEGDIKTVINNMKELLEKDGTFVKEKKFVEPDISDDEDMMFLDSNNEPPPIKKRKFNHLENDHIKDLPVFHEYNLKVTEDVISATVETKPYEINSKQE